MKLSEQQVLELRCGLEKLITEREGMIAENGIRKHQGMSLAYGDVAFEKIRKQIEELENQISWLGEK